MNTETTTEKPIELGEVGCRMPSADGILFGSRSRAIEYAQAKGLSVAGLHDVDTRPTVRDVLKQIERAENAACGMVPQFGGVAGPWDEYFQVYRAGLCDPMWPAEYRWISVFVVVGSNEGLYLHVEAIDTEGARRLLIIGKTCAGGRDTWMRCYESAARISWLLNGNA